MIEIKNIFYPDFKVMSWKKGSIFVVDGRISFKNNSKKLKSIDLKDKYCIPSFVEPHCHIGICRKGEYDTKNALINDLPYDFDNHLYQKFSFKDKSFEDINDRGIKFISVDPGSTSYFSGNCLFLDLIKKKIKKTDSLKIAIGSVPFEYQSKNLNLKNETDCFDKLKEFFSENKVLIKNKIIKVHVYKKSDILKMIEFKEKYHFKLIILHGNDLIKLPKTQLDKINGIILGPIIYTSLREEAKFDFTKTALHLYKNKINFSITTDHPVTPLQYLRLNAIILKNKGIDSLTCIKMITKNAADILNINNFGEIRRGFKANLLIFNGNPMELESDIIYEINNGELKKCQ